MIRCLKNSAVLLWLACLWAIPFNFYFQPLIKAVFPGMEPVVSSSFVFFVVVVVIVSMTNLFAVKKIRYLIKEGQAWERSGIVNKAQTAYMKAVRIYDSLLVPFFFNNRITDELCGTIAGFNVHTKTDNINFNLATAAYLKHHPKDETVVVPWLKRLSRSGTVSTSEHELLSHLAQSTYDSPVISGLLADILISLERKDFCARNFYEKLKDAPEFESRYAAKLNDLIGETKLSLKEERAFSEQEMPLKRDTSKRFQYLIAAMNDFSKLMKKSAAGVWEGTCCFVRLVVRGIVWVKTRERAPFYIKTCIMLFVGSGLLVFMANTMTHVLQPKVVENTIQNIEIPVPKPFTIQVAAYLKRAHAQRYVATLKSKGIDADIKTMDGGGKTWYLIRISQFADKQSAADFGQDLKQRQIIDDFFVNNK